MELKRKELAGPRFWLASLGALSIGVVFVTSARAVVVEIFHADSLAGPMRELRKAVEGKNMDVTINLAAGVSKQLAERILNGDACDVFAPSSPAVVDEDLMIRTVAGSDRDAASWYVVFAGNEIVIVTARGTPLGIRHTSDLAKPCRTKSSLAKLIKSCAPRSKFYERGSIASSSAGHQKVPRRHRA